MNGTITQAKPTKSILPAFTLDKEPNLIQCGNPICGNVFKPSGLAIEPKRFCGEKCRMTAWFIKKAAVVLIPLGKDKAWTALSKVIRE